MRQKELRIALVCYGGVSLAVYMHGVTKELWKLARASRAFHAQEPPQGPTEAAYAALLQRIEQDKGLKLRVLPDIVTGASAGGINAVFLAQAIHSGQSLEPLTRLWLENADVEKLVDPDARPWSGAAKVWTLPAVWYLLRQPDNAVSESVAPETREEVRRKVANLVRGRWFAPPFSGANFSRVILRALEAMAREPLDAPLLPPGHPLDLAVTTTDFRGHREALRLHSPPVVEESEHRLSIAFRARTPTEGGHTLAHPFELTFAARATASFPGAFPPLRVGEIDTLAEGDAVAGPWNSRADFLARIMPGHLARGTAEQVSLIDGSVLVNAPFASAIAALGMRPAQREVDRRIVYIDPSPERPGARPPDLAAPVGFFAAIFGSISAIPREQPIRDNLEALQAQSYEAEKLRRIVRALRPEIEAAVESLFGRTLFLDRPTPRRLANWREKAQQAAAERAGYAFHSYAQTRLAGLIDQLAKLVHASHPEPDRPRHEDIARALRGELERRGLDHFTSGSHTGGSAEAEEFLQEHDLAFRIRRLRLLARRLARDWDADPDLPDDAVDAARDAIYSVLSLYFEREDPVSLGEDFAALAARVIHDPAAVLDALLDRHRLPETDLRAEAMLADLLDQTSRPLRRRMLLGYLGFPFYDVATLQLQRNESLTEFDPVKVDRISPEEARSIREGGTAATLRGTEFFNFGAFFSRAYRENDYLWGRLHGAERMVDLVCSTLPDGFDAAAIQAFKRAVFLAICEEEDRRGLCQPALIEQLRSEIIARLGG